MTTCGPAAKNPPVFLYVLAPSASPPILNSILPPLLIGASAETYQYAASPYRLTSLNRCTPRSAKARTSNTGLNTPVVGGDTTPPPRNSIHVVFVESRRPSVVCACGLASRMLGSMTHIP